MDYALIKNGIVENIIVADDGFIALISPEWDHIEPLDQEAEKVAGPGWTWDGSAFSAPQSATPVSQAEPPKRITNLAFRRRFTAAERAAIEFAAVDRADQTTAQRMQSAGIRAMLKDQEAASCIVLDDPDTVAGVRALETMGLLVTGRADEILSAPVQPNEIPGGV